MCRHRLSVRRKKYAMALSIVSLMNKDSSITGVVFVSFSQAKNLIVSLELIANISRFLSLSVTLTGKRTKTYLITAEKITSNTSAKPSAPRKWTSI